MASLRVPVHMAVNSPGNHRGLDVTPRGQHRMMSLIDALGVAEKKVRTASVTLAHCAGQTATLDSARAASVRSKGLRGRIISADASRAGAIRRPPASVVQGSGVLRGLRARLLRQLGTVRLPSLSCVR